MRWRTMLVTLAVLAATAACGGSDEPDAGLADAPDDPGNPVVADDDDGGRSGGGLGGDVPACPLTDAEVVEITGRPMNPDGPCVWRDEQGVALLTVHMASELAGSATYEFERQQAVDRDSVISEVDSGDLAGFIAARELDGTATLIGPPGSYGVMISSFSESPAENEALLRGLVEAIVG